MSRSFVIAANALILRPVESLELPKFGLNGKMLSSLLKRSVDLALALLFIIGFLPFYVLLALLTLISSRGPVIYRQERIGKEGHSFIMYKFRSMHCDAEKNGPMLSEPNDLRITGWGRFMRRFKLDETPQFFNVLCGNMSIVGPRPERAYWSSQVIRQHPNFKRLTNIKPGITSLGQVKFGYAKDVSEIGKRSRFDLVYLDRQSLWLDIKILLLTVPVVLRGDGK